MRIKLHEYGDMGLLPEANLTFHAKATLYIISRFGGDMTMEELKKHIAEAPSVKKRFPKFVGLTRNTTQQRVLMELLREGYITIGIK